MVFVAHQNKQISSSCVPYSELIIVRGRAENTFIVRQGDKGFRVGAPPLLLTRWRNDIHSSVRSPSVERIPSLHKTAQRNAQLNGLEVTFALHFGRCRPLTDRTIRGTGVDFIRRDSDD